MISRKPEMWSGNFIFVVRAPAGSEAAAETVSGGLGLARELPGGDVCCHGKLNWALLSITTFGHFAIRFAFPGDGQCGTWRRVRAGWERAGTGTQPGASSGTIQHAVAFPYCCPKHPCLMESGQFWLQGYCFGLPR